MDRFCQLYWELDSTTKTGEKVSALRRYFEQAKSADAVWAIYFLVGNRIKRLVKTSLLREWSTERARISPWLFEECYERVGDLAETISLILPPADTVHSEPLHQLIEEQLLPLRDVSPEVQRERVLDLWCRFDSKQIFVLGKLMTGGFRVGVSRRLVVRALAQFSGVEETTLTHRLMGDWEPDVDFFESLIDPETTQTPISKPYPFFLANPIKDSAVETLGSPVEWLAEWKWDGIRAQLIKRENEIFVWSRGGDLITNQFPEVAKAGEALPSGTVIDGELVGWSAAENRPLGFNQLQRRLGRKKPGKKILGDIPVTLLAFDLLEQNDVDIRNLPLDERTKKLKELTSNLPAKKNSDTGKLFYPLNVSENQSCEIRLPPVVTPTMPESWSQVEQLRNTAKSMRAEGLMLKRRTSPYRVGRPVGDWWKWKVDPFTVDAVLLYAQRGHGRRASLYTDYTFAVWKDDDLVPFAKAYSGLTDAEIRDVDAFVRRNTQERFGPVRSVSPELVFELAFENIQRSSRHKSGIAVRFPRISRWRQDKGPQDADRLETIIDMIGDD